MKMNIMNVSALRPCTSCQMCAAVCPVNAITFSLDKEGFYKPFVSDKCTNCSLCTKVCYRIDEEIRVTPKEDLKNLTLLAASANDKQILKETTSGGIGDILARQLIKDGYKVIGVVYDGERDCAVHRVAVKEDDVFSFRGSKYIQSYSVDAFRKMVHDVKRERYAVFGLPCQIYAISRYLERIGRRNDCILVDLYCHGCPSMFIWKKLSSKIKHTTGVVNFDNVIWRSKKRGWGDYVIDVQKNGKTIWISRPLTNFFYDFFFSDQLLNESCNTCKLRDTLLYTDIRLGDYWGPKYRGNLCGVSGVTIVTKQGQLLIDSIKNQIRIEISTMDSFLPYQSYNQVIIPDINKREKWLQMLLNPNVSISELNQDLRKSWSKSMFVKMFLKQILSYLPNSLKRIIRHW